MPKRRRKGILQRGFTRFFRGGFRKFRKTRISIPRRTISKARFNALGKGR